MSWLAVLLLVFNVSVGNALAGSALSGDQEMSRRHQASILLAQAMEFCARQGAQHSLPLSHADHERRCVCCLPCLHGAAALPVAEAAVERPLAEARPLVPGSETGGRDPTRFLVSAPPRAPPFA